MNRAGIFYENMRCLGSYLGRRTRLNTRPSWFWIEPTNHCNLRCIMCPNGMDQVTVEKGFMDFGLYCRIIDEISPFASAITLAVGGESLLHPRFFDMALYAAQKGVKVLLNTNATLLDQKRAERMLDSGFSAISFAFDGFTKSMYEKARVGADFDRTLGNILCFLRLKQSMGLQAPYTVLSILKLGLEEPSEEEKKSFLLQFRGLVDEVRLREVSTWGSTFKDATGFSFRKAERLYPPCSRIWSTAVIGWNGDVLPCIYNANHEYVLGNMREQKFAGIWNGERMLALRKSMLDNSYLSLSPLCEHCIVLGTPPVCGIPSGLRLSLADAATNIFGYGFERLAIRLVNRLRKNTFPSVTVSR